MTQPKTSQPATAQKSVPALPPPEGRLVASAHPQREQPCPQCGYPMSDLKGGREAICGNCGFKDSCCY